MIPGREELEKINEKVDRSNGEPSYITLQWLLDISEDLLQVWKFE